MPVLTIPKILRENLTEEGAEALVELINKADVKTKENILEYLEEKYERRLVEVTSELRVSFEKRIAEVKTDLEKKIYEAKNELEEKIYEIKSDLEKQIAGVRMDLEKVKSEFEVKISEVKTDIEKRMANYHADIIRWMFIFWAGQIGVMVSILLIFFRK